MWLSNIRSLTSVSSIVLFVCCAGFDVCQARAGWGWDWRWPWRPLPWLPSPTPIQQPPPLPPPARRLPPPTQPPPQLLRPLSPPPVNRGETANLTTFNVLDFGAKGNGHTPDTAAFQAAWQAACQIEASKVLVPANHQFLVGPITFSGEHCRMNIVFQLDGTIVAPRKRNAWGDQRAQWIHFIKTKGLTVQGKGTIDGSGSIWWQSSISDDLEDDETPSVYPLDGDDNDDDEYNDDDDDDNKNSAMPQKMGIKARFQVTRPTAMKLYRADNVTVKDIKIQNTPSCHLNFQNCRGVQIHDVTVSSPGDSPNTDGIQLHNCQHVIVHDSNLACGDDCIAISTGSSDVRIHNVSCGPGHGISIGSLGKDRSKACVSDIIVQDVYMHDTSNGVRIKSWQGGQGSVHGVTFSNIKVSRVEIPIIIDQFYCDHRTCRNQTSAVAVSGIIYKEIRGTFTREPVRFACSDAVPCMNITLNDIELKPDLKEVIAGTFKVPRAGKLMDSSLLPSLLRWINAYSYRLGRIH